jgi:signal transduction histidine kinase
MTGVERDRVGVSQWQRLLLPAAVLQQSGGRRTPRDWIVDALMYAFGIAFGVAILASTTQYRSFTTVVLDVACGAVAFVALWFRRRRPTEVAVLVIALSSFSALAAAAALAACFNAALRLPARALVSVAAFGLLCAAVSAAAYGNAHGYDWTGLLVGVLLTTVAVGWGLFARAQRDLVASLHERADRLENERRLHEAQARDAERRRIAREMHDVLAHRISLLSVHAGALEFRPDAPPEEIAQAAGVVRGAAHSALQELREVIGVLRAGDHVDEQAGGAPAVGRSTSPVEAGAAGAAGGADGARPWAAGAGQRATDPPQPTLAEVPALVDESRLAGARVAVRIDVPGAEDMPAALGRTAYRIVQEGLTNARKHAPGAAVDVQLRGRDGMLMVSVVSRRPVGARVVAPVRDTAALPPGGGSGLIGLGERVALAGGELEHGPDAGGDFVVRATLPWAGAA